MRVDRHPARPRAGRREIPPASQAEIAQAVSKSYSEYPGLTESELRSEAVPVVDDYASDLIHSDEIGADAVIDFDMGAAAAMVFVDVDPVAEGDDTAYICRVTVDGTTPSAIRGWRARSGQATPIPAPCPAGTVKVWAPTGVSVSVQATRR